MRLLTTVPVILGKPVNIWEGLLLLGLITLQVWSGVSVFRGKGSLLRYHKFNAGLIVVVVLIHAYFGIGVWFFAFHYGR